MPSTLPQQRAQPKATLAPALCRQKAAAGHVGPATWALGGDPPFRYKKKPSCKHASLISKLLQCWDLKELTALCRKTTKQTRLRLSYCQS